MTSSHTVFFFVYFYSEIVKKTADHQCWIHSFSCVIVHECSHTLWRFILSFCGLCGLDCNTIVRHRRVCVFNTASKWLHSECCNPNVWNGHLLWHRPLPRRLPGKRRNPSPFCLQQIITHLCIKRVPWRGADTQSDNQMTRWKAYWRLSFVADEKQRVRLFELRYIFPRRSIENDGFPRIWRHTKSETLRAPILYTQGNDVIPLSVFVTLLFLL